jgi:hypothetical protein
MEGDSTNLKVKFDSFVNQNIESVLTHSQNMKSHPVNKEALEIWRGQMIKNINQNEDLKNDRPNLIEWTNRFADKLQCISHKQFLIVFNLILHDLILKLEKEKFKTVILCMEGKANKSSIWLAILMWNKIKSYITHVMSFADANIYLRSKYDDSSICVIYPDDAAYSGEQYVRYYKEIHGRAENIGHCILIPYISKLALKGADVEKPLCPSPVYKWLSYTFNDKTIKTEEILLDFIKINKHMCYNCTREAKYVCSKCLNQVFCGEKCQINCN